MNDYDILEVNNNADIQTIKASYKKLIKKYHPDKNDNIDACDKFIKINTAYKNIINKNNNYSCLNIFNALYQHGIINNYLNILYNMYILNNTKKNKIIIINCSLEEIYNSCIKTIKYKRKIATSYFNIVSEDKIIDLYIDNNNYHNQKIIYKNYGDGIEYGKEYSDLILIIKEEKHNFFIRDKNNLIANINLTLKESLTCNTTVKILLLNNSYLDYKINKIIYPGYQDVLKNYGLCTKTNNGNLILNFIIIFPNKLTNDQILQINKIF